MNTLKDIFRYLQVYFSFLISTAAKEKRKQKYTPLSLKKDRP